MSSTVTWLNQFLLWSMELQHFQECRQYPFLDQDLVLHFSIDKHYRHHFAMNLFCSKPKSALPKGIHQAKNETCSLLKYFTLNDLAFKLSMFLNKNFYHTCLYKMDEKSVGSENDGFLIKSKQNNQSVRKWWLLWKAVFCKYYIIGQQSTHLYSF